MPIALPETCTDPTIVPSLGISLIPDTILVLDARETIRITEAFFTTLFEHAIDLCEPHYAHVYFIINDNSPVFDDISRLCLTYTSQTHTVDHVTDSECLGICVPAYDFGLPFDGMVYPHPDCPIHGS